MKKVKQLGRLLSVIIIICPMVVFQSVFALSSADSQSLYNDTVWYDPSASLNYCSIGSITPGSGAPDGAQFPNLDPNAMASAINTWISQEQSNSELAGLGATIVAGAQHSNINPFLIVSIAHEETSLASPSDFNVQNGANAFGRTAAPGQPSFQGAKLWYKWSSVEASVDYTAPENQNIAGGGDIASYIRSQYGSQVDSNSLVGMMEAYAPPVENNTAQYIANLKNWISQLVQLTGSNSSPNSSTPVISNGCGGGSSTCLNDGTAVTGSAAILCEAEKYAGIYYLWGGGHEAYSTFRQICPEAAIASAASQSTPANPGPCATDCSGLVSVAVDGAFDQDYTWKVLGGTMFGSGSQYWVSVPIDQAQPGDIVTTTIPDDHVEIVDHVSGGTIYTFGSHYTGVQTSKVSEPTSYWVSGAWRWTGPGS